LSFDYQLTYTNVQYIVALIHGSPGQHDQSDQTNPVGLKIVRPIVPV